MSQWDNKFIKCDKYKIVGFLYAKAASTTIENIFNNLNREPSGSANNIIETVPANYRTFVFVRNPYSRSFSSYCNEVCPQLEKRNIHVSFSDFTFRICKWKAEGVFRTFHSLVRRLPDNTEIYRFEEFPTKMEEILHSIGVKNYRIPHNNPTIQKFAGIDYKTQYSKLAKAIIGYEYKWDITNLNYTFDSYGDLPTIKELKAAC